MTTSQSIVIQQMFMEPGTALDARSNPNNQPSGGTKSIAQDKHMQVKLTVLTELLL